MEYFLIGCRTIRYLSTASKTLICVPALMVPPKRNKLRLKQGLRYIRGEIHRFEGDSPASGLPPPPYEGRELTKNQV